MDIELTPRLEEKKKEKREREREERCVKSLESR